jgi:phosphonate transport system substrate-binding protein
MSAVVCSLTFAYDGNFRFDIEDPAWKHFFDGHHVRPVRYDDMAELTEALTGSVQTVSYLPAANYFYVRDNRSYEPVASALYAAEDTANLTSVLVVRFSSAATELEHLRGGRLGYAHPYCTTSYFAPALLLHERGDSIADFFDRIVVVPPYEGQIDAVVDGRIDATMVQEDVWRKTPDNARTTRVIARKDHLPTPLVIVDANADPGLKRDLGRVVLSHRPPITPETLFSGFVSYQRRQVEGFFAASARALPALAAVVRSPLSTGSEASDRPSH